MVIYYAIMFIDLDTLLRTYVMVVVTALPLSLFVLSYVVARIPFD